MAEVKVAVDRPYSVWIEAGAISRIPQLLPAGCAKVAILHAPAVRDTARAVAEGLAVETLLIELPDAEAAKTMSVLAECWEQLGAAGFTRSDCVIGLGGGATTDLAGFVAASWLRGIAVLQVPTTVLGMVDAAVGGKTGINTAAGKNLVGAFHHPRAVLCDLELLATLPTDEIRQGLAEVVKCGFIADPKILELLGGLDLAALPIETARFAELVTRAVSVKATVVAADFREDQAGGLGREILNYGHTLGHAIERVEEYRWRHGEAISVGMVFAAELAAGAGLMSPGLVAEHRAQLQRLGLPITYPADRWPELRAAMSLDKKSRGATLRFIVLAGLAAPKVLAGPSEAALAAAFNAVAAK